MAVPKKVLKWREKQAPGEIMKPSTFKKIEEGAGEKYGSKERGKKVAGAAYWDTVRSKYRSEHSPAHMVKMETGDLSHDKLMRVQGEICKTGGMMDMRSKK